MLCVSGSGRVQQLLLVRFGINASIAHLIEEILFYMEVSLQFESALWGFLFSSLHFWKRIILAYEMG